MFSFPQESCGPPGKRSTCQSLHRPGNRQQPRQEEGKRGVEHFLHQLQTKSRGLKLK